MLWSSEAVWIAGLLKSLRFCSETCHWGWTGVIEIIKTNQDESCQYDAKTDGGGGLICRKKDKRIARHYAKIVKEKKLRVQI